MVRPLGRLLEVHAILRGIDCTLDVGMYLLLEEDLAECHELVGRHNHVKLKVRNKVMLQLFEFRSVQDGEQPCHVSQSHGLVLPHLVGNQETGYKKWSPCVLMQKDPCLLFEGAEVHQADDQLCNTKDSLVEDVQQKLTHLCWTAVVQSLPQTHHGFHIATTLLVKICLVERTCHLVLWKSLYNTVVDPLFEAIQSTWFRLYVGPNEMKGCRQERLL